MDPLVIDESPYFWDELTGPFYSSFFVSDVSKIIFCVREIDVGIIPKSIDN